MAAPNLNEGVTSRSGLGSAAVITATVRQEIRTVPIFEPCLILVLEGTKEIGLDMRTTTVEAGAVLAVRAGARPDIGNVPDAATGCYRALVLSFSPDVVAWFARHYPGHAARAGGGPAWRRIEGGGVADAVLHASDGIASALVSPEVARHRLLEVLLALAERGVGWPLPGDETASDRVRVLVAGRPSTPWAAVDAARALGISEATLRRRLAAEGTCFRDVLADIRLGNGLMLLQTTRMGIAEIALACGYESPSRFARRFRERFGLTPSEMRGEDGRKRIGANSDRLGRE